MRATALRKFTLVDAIVLVAALAISLVEVRRNLREDWFIYGDWSWDNARELSYGFNQVLSIIALCLGCALCILRLRTPRPSLRRIFRQPGTAACATVICYSLILMIGVSIDGWEFFSDVGWGEYFCYMFSMLGGHALGGPVAGAWIVLWIGKVGRLEPSWIDRTGRVLGIYWIVSAPFFAPRVG
jgi:hypothetical protein